MQLRSCFPLLGVTGGEEPGVSRAPAPRGRAAPGGSLPRAGSRTLWPRSRRRLQPGGPSGAAGPQRGRGLLPLVPRAGPPPHRDLDTAAGRAGPRRLRARRAAGPAPAAPEPHAYPRRVKTKGVAARGPRARARACCPPGPSAPPAAAGAKGQRPRDLEPLAPMLGAGPARGGARGAGGSPATATAPGPRRSTPPHPARHFRPRPAPLPALAHAASSRDVRKGRGTLGHVLGGKRQGYVPNRARMGRPRPPSHVAGGGVPEGGSAYGPCGCGWGRAGQSSSPAPPRR